MENTQKFYTIAVGGAAPADVLFGFLNKDSMQPDENTKPGKVQLGVVGMPNFSIVWALKLVDPKTKMPTGQLEFLKWGTDKEKDGQVAGATEIRYLPNSASLDKQYQEIVQKLKVRDEDAEISLPLGLNKFDYKDKGPLIKMLKHHTFNGDSPCRDPNNTNVQYIEYNPSNQIVNKTREIGTRRLAEEYVMNCEHDEKALACLASVFELNAQDTDEILYNTLLDKATENPKHFILVIQTKRDDAKRDLLTAQESGFVDFAAPGEVNIRNGAKPINVISGMEAFESVEEKINHLVKNYVDPDYYEGILKIQAKVKEYAMAQLQ